MSATPAPLAASRVDPSSCVTLREYVTAYAADAGLTMKAFAQSTGVSRSKFFAALRDPRASGKFLERLAEFTGVRPDDLGHLQGERAQSTATRTPLRDLFTTTAAARGVTVSALVEATGVARTTVFDLMAGRGHGSPATLAAVAAALGVDVVVVARACGAALNPVSAARLRTGLTRAAFADKLRVSEASIAAAEAGKPLRCDVAARLAAAIDDEQVRRQLQRTRQAACVTHTAIGKAVDRVCAREGITFREAARRAGMSHQHLAQIVSGAIRSPGAAVRDQLAALLGVPAAHVGQMLTDARPPYAPEGAHLARRRTAAGLTQAQVAAQLGVVAPAVSMWETGAANVPARHRRHLERLLAG